jgi:uncharacterized protein YndB with AHSA1/START domain
MNNATTRSVVIEKEMAHSPEKIWRALTESNLIQQWLMPNEFQPSPGHRFQFRTTPSPHWNGVVDSEVLAVEPHKKLSYTWSSGGLSTVVSWTLAPTKNGTLVRMEQSGFPPDQENNYRGATYGWQKFMGGLETTVAELK